MGKVSTRCLPVKASSLHKIESKIVEKANNFHSSIKSTAELGSETEITFSETKVYEGVRFNKEPVLDGQTDY